MITYFDNTNRKDYFRSHLQSNEERESEESELKK